MTSSAEKLLTILDTQVTGDDIPWEDEDMTPEEIQLAALYGKRGPPEDTPAYREQLAFERAWGHPAMGSALLYEAQQPLPLLLPAPVANKPYLDHLGHVVVPKENAVTPTPKHRVTLLRDHRLAFPDLYLEVHITGPKGDQHGFPALFARSGCLKADTPEQADLVVFTGGADVDPQLYGEVPHPSVHCDPERDSEEMDLFLLCKSQGIPMLGVCRGAQFLHVMHGGKLYQDVDEHVGDHRMFDIRAKEWIEKVSSVHHQMVIPNSNLGMEVLATTSKAKTRWRNDKTCDRGPIADCEAFFYRDTCTIGIQGHPEYAGYNFFARWTLDTINDLIIMNPDIDWVGGRRRIKPDILALREDPSKSVIKNAVAAAGKEKN